MSRARREKESHDGNSLGVVLSPTEIRSEPESKIQSFPILGGLHHRYEVAAVAAFWAWDAARVCVAVSRRNTISIARATNPDALSNSPSTDVQSVRNTLGHD
jgi:hypothetical protein